MTATIFFTAFALLCALAPVLGTDSRVPETMRFRGSFLLR